MTDPPFVDPLSTCAAECAVLELSGNSSKALHVYAAAQPPVIQTASGRENEFAHTQCTVESCSVATRHEGMRPSAYPWHQRRGRGTAVPSTNTGRGPGVRARARGRARALSAVRVRGECAVRGRHPDRGARTDAHAPRSQSQERVETRCQNQYAQQRSRAAAAAAAARTQQQQQQQCRSSSTWLLGSTYAPTSHIPPSQSRKLNKKL